MGTDTHFLWRPVPSAGEVCGGCWTGVHRHREREGRTPAAFGPLSSERSLPPPPPPACRIPVTGRACDQPPSPAAGRRRARPGGRRRRRAPPGLRLRRRRGQSRPAARSGRPAGDDQHPAARRPAGQLHRRQYMAEPFLREEGFTDMQYPQSHPRN